MSAWAQIWPNLAANVIWVPLVWLHHHVMAGRVQALKQHVTVLHEQHEQLIRHAFDMGAETTSKGL
jgi:hypothetical protein